MKYAAIFLSLTIVFSSYGMENFINSVIFTAPPYMIAESMEDNQHRDEIFLRSIWRACRQWISSHIPAQAQEDPAPSEDLLAHDESN